jgi:hypothetical protein
MKTKTFAVGMSFALLALLFGMGGSVYAKEKPRPSKTPKVETSAVLNVACIQGAIVERDNAVISAVNAYHTAVVSALTTRRDAFSSAWALTDRTARKNALKTALETFRSARKSASETFHKAKESAWSEFAKDRKDCGVGAQDGHGNAKLDSTI